MQPTRRAPSSWAAARSRVGAAAARWPTIAAPIAHRPRRRAPSARHRRAAAAAAAAGPDARRAIPRRAAPPPLAPTEIPPAAVAPRCRRRRAVRPSPWCWSVPSYTQRSSRLRCASARPRGRASGQRKAPSSPPSARRAASSPPSWRRRRATLRRRSSASAAAFASPAWVRGRAGAGARVAHRARRRHHALPPGRSVAARAVHVGRGGGGGAGEGGHHAVGRGGLSPAMAPPPLLSPSAEGIAMPFCVPFHGVPPPPAVVPTTAQMPTPFPVPGASSIAAEAD